MEEVGGAVRERKFKIGDRVRRVAHFGGGLEGTVIALGVNRLDNELLVIMRFDSAHDRASVGEIEFFEYAMELIHSPMLGAEEYEEAMAAQDLINGV